MKEVEITVKINESLESTIKKLEKIGFKKIDEDRIEDIYMTQLLDKLNRNNIPYILSNSVLLRYIENNGKPIRKITYKDKVYENGIVISEVKTNVECDSLEKAEELFSHLNFRRLIRVAYDILVMKKDDLELAFHNVEGLGLVLEYESSKNFENCSNDEIIKEKENMLQELKALGLNVGNDYDLKKAYELILKTL